MLLLAALAIVWSWWAANDGAFFGTVLLPGTILLCAITVLLAWAAPWRASLRPSQPVAIALVLLAGLGVWAALSALWSPAPDVAIETAAVTLVKGDLRAIVKAIRLSRATMANVEQNLFFAFVYNALGVPLAGGVLYPAFVLLLSPILAAAAMSFSSVSVIGNALRLRAIRL